MPIQMLNDECLIHIFQFLPIRDRIRIERVCKRWRTLSSDRDSWGGKKILDLSASFWGFTEVKICETVFYNILQRCGRYLTGINLSQDQDNSLKQSTSTMSTIVKFCPNLENINIAEVIASDIKILAENYRNITKLKIHLKRNLNTHDSETNELKNLFRANCNLKFLELVKTKLDDCLLWLPAQSMQTIILRKCSIRHFNRENFLMVLKKIKNLRHFETYECSDMHENILQIASEYCKNLTILVLDNKGRSRIRYRPYRRRVHTFCFAHIENLQRLEVCDNFYISDQFLADLVKHCKQLTYLNISGCVFVTDKGLANLATLCKLEKLCINSLSQITGDGLKKVCRLKELYCKWSPFIKDEAISMFIKSSPELRLLDIFGCKNITEITLQAAIDVCRSRSNITLTMGIGDTQIEARQINQLPDILKIIKCTCVINMEFYVSNFTLRIY